MFWKFRLNVSCKTKNSVRNSGYRYKINSQNLLILSTNNGLTEMNYKINEMVLELLHKCYLKLNNKHPKNCEKTQE